MSYYQFTEVKNPKNCKPGPLHGAAGIVRATFNPASCDQLPFPNDYKYNSCLLPRKHIDWAERIQNFKVRPDDIWVLGFPKSGTTWMQNIVYPMINNLESSIILPDANFVEFPSTIDKIDGDEEFGKFVELQEKVFEELDKIPSPRLMKSHLPAYLLPKEIWTVRPKLIYMSRDVKDVAVSYYHMSCNLAPFYTGSAHDFFHSFYNDYIPLGPYYEHIQSFRQLNHFDHLLMMTYEELSANTFNSVKRVNQFLNYTYSDEELRQLIDRVSFGKMREKLNDMPTYKPGFEFCRNGKIGGYRNDMPEEDVKNFNEWTLAKKMELKME